MDRPPQTSDWPEYFESFNEGYFRQHPHHDWPAWKFDMDEQEVFTTLASRFNTTTMPLMDRDAFCRDVAYLSTIAQDRDELFRLLQERRDMRFKELRELFLRGIERMIGLVGEIPDHHWCDIMHMNYYNSFDTIVRFIVNYPPKELQRPWKPADVPPPTEASPHPARHTRNEQSATPPFVATSPAPPPSTSSPASPASSSSTPSDPALPRPPSPAELRAAARERRRTKSPPRQRTTASARREHGGDAFRSTSRVQHRSRDTSQRRSRQLRQQRVESVEASSQATAAAAARTTTTSRSKQEASGHKRKRDLLEEEEEDCSAQQTQTAGAQRRSDGRKRTRITADTDLPDTRRRSKITTDIDHSPAGTTSGNKKKRGADQAPTVQSREAPSPTEKIHATRGAGPRASSTGENSPSNRRRKAYSPPLEKKKKGTRSTPLPISSRVTRTQRQRSSRGDVQLFQLGEGGRAEVQSVATTPHHR